jgi:uncharacterized protein (TIGR02453 family)
VHSPGYYVHIDPEQVFIGIGMWRPEAHALSGIRARIAAKPAEWRRAIGDKTFQRHFKLGGESLMRPPRGYDKNLEFIDDIKRKSYMGVKNLDRDDCLSSQFQRNVETSFRAAELFMRFLCKSVGVRF